MVIIISWLLFAFLLSSCFAGVSGGVSGGCEWALRSAPTHRDGYVQRRSRGSPSRGSARFIRRCGTCLLLLFPCVVAIAWPRRSAPRFSARPPDLRRRCGRLALASSIRLFLAFFRPAAEPRDPHCTKNTPPVTVG